MGIGDWGLGIGDWGLGPIPNPQSPIPMTKIYILFLYSIVFGIYKMEDIIIKYDIKHKSRIKIFGDKFVENNKGKCKMKIGDKIFEITEYYRINDSDKKKDLFNNKINNTR
jgi:hypothetical protein